MRIASRVIVLAAALLSTVAALSASHSTYEIGASHEARPRQQNASLDEVIEAINATPTLPIVELPSHIRDAKSARAFIQSQVAHHEASLTDLEAFERANDDNIALDVFLGKMLDAIDQDKRHWSYIFAWGRLERHLFHPATGIYRDEL